MNPRTLWLTLAASAVGLLFGGDAAYRGWIERPRQEYEQQLDEWETTLRDAENDAKAAQRKLKSLPEFAARALPSEPELARSAYQAYLLELMESCRWESRTMDVGAPTMIQIKSRTNKGKKRTIGYSLRASLHGQTTLTQWIQFLRRFEEAPHLQQITDVSLNPLGNGTSLDVTLQIEAVGLENADRKQDLSQWQRDPDSMIAPQADRLTVQRNLFARGSAKALEEIHLRAITYGKNGQAEAWFQAKGKPTQITTPGQRLDVPSFEIEVLEIEADRVCLSLNLQKAWLKLGDSLAQLQTIEPE